MVGVLLLPLVIAVALAPMRRWRFVVAPLATTAALVTGISLLTGAVEPLIVIGRILELSGRQQVGWAYCSLLLAATLLTSYQLPQDRLHYTLALLGLSALIASTAAMSLSLGAILLLLGMLLCVMTLTSEAPGMADRGMRVLILVVVAGMLMLMGSWALERSLLLPDDPAYTGMARMTLTLGMLLALGVAPGTLYLGSAQEGATPLAIVLCNVLLPAAVLMRAGEWVAADVNGQLLGTMTTLGVWLGAATVVLGSVGALLQRNVGKMLGYVSVADLGVVMLGLALDTETGIALALVHFGIRGVALLLGGNSAGVLRQSYGYDDMETLEGALRLAPWSVIGVLAAGLCLAGMPPWGGFVTRLSLLAELAEGNRWMVPALILSSVGGCAALVRFGLAATARKGETGQREPTWYRVVALVLAGALLLTSFAPYWVSLLPSTWQQVLFEWMLFPVS